MSLTKPIPLKLRTELNADKWYKKCCIADETCEGRIQFHHNMQWKGSRLNEKFAILPVCEAMHRKADTREIRERLDHIMLQRMSDEQLEYYSKARNYKQYKIYLREKYGKQSKSKLGR